MKKTLLFSAFFSFSTLGILTSNAQSTAAQKTDEEPKQETVTLKETRHDFGKIPQGKPVYYTFEMQNIGKDSLKIEHVQTSCGCTTPEWDKAPVAQNGIANIKVGYNAASEGNFQKSITVIYNGGQTKVMYISGLVWKTPDRVVPANASVNILKQLN